MKTQKQMFYDTSRKIGDRYQFFNWLLQQPNRPSKEELVILKKKNPKWNGYPES